MLTLVNEPQPKVTFSKVTAGGKLLPGGMFRGATCTRWPNDLSWQCQDLGEYPWFNGVPVPSGEQPDTGLWLTGTTGNKFSEDIQMRGGWSVAIMHCLAVQELEPPDGYVARTAPALVCPGPGGWTAANAAGITVEPWGDGLVVAGGLGDWQVTNVAPTRTTTISLVNEPTPTLTFEKVDAAGKLLPGGNFVGQSCTRIGDEPDWTCLPLHVHDWFNELGLRATGSTQDNSSTQIDTEGGWDLPIQHCVTIAETSPPPGYLAEPDPALVCRGPGGWTVENAAGITLGSIKGGLGAWTVTNDPVSKATTLRLANARPLVIATPTTPAVLDACNPPGVASNVTWAGALPASTPQVAWTEDSGTRARTASLVDPARTTWTGGATAPVAFSLPADAGVACPAPTASATPEPSKTLKPSGPRGIGATTGEDGLGSLLGPLALLGVTVVGVVRAGRRRR